MCVMSIIGWIILGLIVGFIASKVANKTGEGFFLYIVLGIVGARVGGFLYSRREWDYRLQTVQLGGRSDRSDVPEAVF
jgi:uncharacterized membrane protein YeaQ/YmgE (transglycosylase-associated protein family)